MTQKKTPAPIVVYSPDIADKTRIQAEFQSFYVELVFKVLEKSGLETGSRIKLLDRLIAHYS